MIRVSRLLNPKDIDNMFPRGEIADYNRCSGACTAETFRIIGEAMSNPGQPIPVVDRSRPYNEMETKHYRQYFYRMLEDRIAKNGLKHLKLTALSIGSRRYTLTYDIMATYALHKEVKEVWKEV